MWAHNIKKSQTYKIKDLLENLPFYTSEIEKNIKIFTNARILSELPPKKPKKLTNYQLSRALPFFPKISKRPKRLTKLQILKKYSTILW